MLNVIAGGRVDWKVLLPAQIQITLLYVCTHSSLWEKTFGPKRDRCSCADRLTVCVAIVVPGRPADAHFLDNPVGPETKTWRILLSRACLIMEILLIYSAAVHRQLLCQSGIYRGNCVSCIPLRKKSAWWRQRQGTLSSRSTNQIYFGLRGVPKWQWNPYRSWEVLRV